MQVALALDVGRGFMVRQSPKEIEELDRFRRLYAETTDPLAARLLEDIIAELETGLVRPEPESGSGGTRLVFMVRQRRADRSIELIQLEWLAQHLPVPERLGGVTPPIAARKDERHASPGEDFRNRYARRSPKVYVQDGDIEYRLVRQKCILDAPGLGHDSVSELLDHLDEHHSDQGFVFDEEKRSSGRLHLNPLERFDGRAFSGRSSIFRTLCAAWINCRRTLITHRVTAAEFSDHVQKC
ncbi:hypothetical protein [Bradyrhizobium sp. 25ACV]